MGKSADLVVRARRLGLRLGKYGRHETRRIRPDGAKPVNWYLARGGERIGEYVKLADVEVEIFAREGRRLPENGTEENMAIIRTEWSDLSGLDETGYATALACCRGAYQRDFLHGVENLSGSTLTGRASQYGGQYGLSRVSVIRRWRAAGLKVSERTGAHNARILVVENGG